ncbi:MAG: radical SAM protein [Candidatus Omnitrophota bacterium]
MKYKFAIVNPKARNVLLTEPLNIIILATYLKEFGISVKIIDEVAGDDVMSAIESFKPDLVGFTATTCAYPRALQLLKTVKSMGYLTIIGGVHASTLPEKAIEDGFDMVLVGEGEKTLLSIITKGEKKGIFKATRQDILKNEEICLPDRKLINMNFYLNSKNRLAYDANLEFVPYGQRMASMLTSRGCPFSCIFCHNTWRGTPIRVLSPEAIISEIEELMREHGVRYFLFLDDDFFQIKSRVVKFCELLLGGNIKINWATAARADSLDDEVLRISSRAGCRRLSFGFESGSQRILDVLNKKTSVEKNFIAAKLCNKYNIGVLGLFMIGNPTETKADIQLTWKFIKSTPLDSVAISTTTPFPGTQLWKWCQDKGYIHQDLDFSDFYFTFAPIQMPETFTPAEILRIKRRLIAKIYLFLPKIRMKFIINFLRNPLVMFQRISNYVPFMSNKD